MLSEGQLAHSTVLMMMRRTMWTMCVCVFAASLFWTRESGVSVA